MLLGLCFGAAAWGLFFLGHIAAMRLAAPAQRTRIDKLLFMSGLLAIPATLGMAMSLDHLAWWHGGWLPGSLWGMLGYFALFTLYMPFFYTVAASLSVGTIVLLDRQADASLPVAALFKHFGSRDLVQGRLTAMTQHGFLSKHADVYRLTPKGRFVAQAFAILKRLWRLEPGG